MNPLHALGDEFAASWAGVPFQWDGRSRAGIDCWGLVVAFHAHVKGQRLPDWTRGREPASWIARTIARRVTRDHWRPLPGPVDGCLVKALAHVGIIWRGGVLHARRPGVSWQGLPEFSLLYPGCEFGEFVP